MIENFTFNDIVLYSKGWYKKTDLVSDLGYILATFMGGHLKQKKKSPDLC